MRRLSFDSSDWQLMRACPCALMLVRPHPWMSIPRLAALVDVSVQENLPLAETIVHTSEYFTLGCRGEFDIIYSETGGSDAEIDSHRASLERLTREFHVPARNVHVLSGEPELTLPEFTARRQYDVLVMGGLTHRQGISTLVGTLTSKLVDALECDFLLVKRDSRRAGGEVRLPRDRAGTSALDPQAEAGARPAGTGAQTGPAGCGSSWLGS